MSNTEIKQAGQAYQLARHPLNFYQSGNMHGSYVKSCSIHNTYNRAINLFEVNYLDITDNVVYYTMGSSIYMEHGSEAHNTFDSNLVMTAIPSMSMMGSDQIPANFYIRNPTNIFRNNRAAGASRFGYWFDLHRYTRYTSRDQYTCPWGNELEEFANNKAHSNGGHGLKINPYLAPRTNACWHYKNNNPLSNEEDKFAVNPYVQAVFKNFHTWRNEWSGVRAVQLGAVHFDGLFAVDSLKFGFDITRSDMSPKGTAALQNSYIKATSYADGEPEYQKHFKNRGVGAVGLPVSDFFVVSNVKFDGYSGNNWALTTCPSCKYYPDSGSRTLYFNKLSFVGGSTNKVQRDSTVPTDILIDEDGSLIGDATNFPSGGTLLYNQVYLYHDNCSNAVVAGLDSQVCPPQYTFKRVAIYNAAPWSLRYKKLKIRQAKLETIDNPRCNTTQSGGKKKNIGNGGNRLLLAPYTPCDHKKITVKTDRSKNTLQFSSIGYRRHNNPSSSWVMPIEAGTDYESHFTSG
jgi:hypothetical protein